MKSDKIVGILLLLIYVCVATALLNDAFIKPYNLQNLLRSSSMFAIIGIGAALVIVTGGISLATGSLIGLVGCTMTMVLKSWMEHPPNANGAYVFQMIGGELLLVSIAWIIWDSMVKRRGVFSVAGGCKVSGLVIGGLLVACSFWMRSAEFGPWLTMASAVVVALFLSIHLGLLHGLLITKLKLQPFVVTLCGLMCYRGLSRYLTSDQTQGLGTEFNDSLRLMAIGKPCTVTFVFLLFSVAAILYGVWGLLFKQAGWRGTGAFASLVVLLVGGAMWLLFSPIAAISLAGKITIGMGGVSLVYFATRWSLWRKSDQESALIPASQNRESRVWSLVTIVIGAVLAVIASSRYWDGWTEFVQVGNTFASFGGSELKFFTLDLPQSAVDRPAVLMGYSIYPLVACFVALAIVSGKKMLQGGFEMNRLLSWASPLVAVLISLVGLFLMKGWIGDETISLTDMSTAFQWNSVEGADDAFISGINVILWKMGGVFFTMAALTGGVLWLGKSWTKASGVTPKILVLFVGLLSVLWLLSKTAIHETVVQTPFFFLLIIGVVAAVFLNKTVYGRYLLALGSNREAARYSGINTDNMEILAYTLCALCGGIGAVLFTLDSNNVEPSGHGSFYELYAIAAAVLGGCSLRGGEGSILGVVIGASIMRVLYNAPDMIGIASQLEMFTIGIVILIGIVVDETARRVAAKQDSKVAG